jgi:hypothetical protein
MLKGSSRLMVVIFLGLALTGCNTIPTHKVHYSVLENNELEKPKRILLLPMDVKVSEFTAGGLTEEVESWTKLAEQLINQELRARGHALSDYEFVEMPTLTQEEQATLEQHLALLDTLGGNVLSLGLAPGGAQAWEPKMKHFDYTIGDGLAFLKERTGADMALMIYGNDLVSSEGRKAAFIFAAAFGVGIPMGHAILVGGMLDLESGDVLWLNHEVSVADITLREPEGVKTLLGGLFSDYPGTESFRKYVSGTQ